MITSIWIRLASPAAALVAATSLVTAAIPFTYVDNGTSITITDCPTTESGSVVIPDMIDGKPVTGIGANAFEHCKAITAIHIPATVASIGASAFKNCAQLESAAIPDSVTTIESSIFATCTALKTANLPNGLSRIPPGTFAGCESLTSISIPDSVTAIDRYAFSGCGALSKLDWPSNLESIGTGAFWNCGLTEITLPDSLSTIGDSAFGFCKRLTSVSLPANVKRLGAYAFTSSGLRTANLGRSRIPTVGNSCFAECKYLRRVQLPPTANNVSLWAFKNCTSLKKIHLPAKIHYLYHNAFEGAATNQIHFQGNAPRIIAGDRLYRHDPKLEFFYLDGTKGFTTPRWLGRPCHPFGPEIEVIETQSAVLQSGRSFIHFGNLLPGNERTREFRIRNIGTKSLRGLRTQVQGLHAKDYLVDHPTKRKLRPGQSTVFRVTFYPTDAGKRSARLRIHSNDANEGIFRVRLGGQGME